MKFLLQTLGFIILFDLVHSYPSPFDLNTNNQIPKKLQKALPCDNTQCQLPYCRCASTSVPGGLPTRIIPQIVTIGFNVAVRDLDYAQFYEEIFNGRKNPNGCQIGLTFFVSNNYTDYALVEDLHYRLGYEMADNSVDHRVPTTWWENASEDEWRHEVMDQRTILNKWGNIPYYRVRGFRSPFLVTSETELEVLYNSGFLYEATMGTRTNYWPFTLDYKSPICVKPATCPVNSYPGLWIVPNILYNQTNGVPCATIADCTVPHTEKEWYDFFVDNFNTHYQDNKAPFGIYSNSAWFFYGSERVNAMKSFLNKLGGMKDVYIVTHTQMLDWVRNPTPLSSINHFYPWKCSSYTPPPRCDYKAPACNKVYPDNMVLKSCTSPCPENYPGYGNPYGY